MVQAGCLCPAGHRREPTALSTRDLLARYFKGLITLYASEFWLGAPVLCVRCATGSPAAEGTSGVWVLQAGAALNQGWHPPAHPHRIKPKVHNLMHWCCFEVFKCKGTCNISELAVLWESVEFFWCAASVCQEWTQGCHAHHAQWMGSTHSCHGH